MRPRVRIPPAPATAELGPRVQGFAARFGLPVVITLVAVAISLGLMPVTEAVTYVPLVGAVAVSVWFGGLAPGLVSIALGWPLALLLLASPSPAFDVDNRDDAVRWGISLAVALVVAWVSWLMRSGHERAAAAAAEATRTNERVERLQGLASALSAAASRRDVARALVDGASDALGAAGCAVGILDGDELEILDPAGAAQQTFQPGLRLPLETRAPITAAARERRDVWASTRAEFEARFPDGARLAPEAAGALAVPIRSAERLVGSISFRFAGPDAVDEDLRVVARIVADLGGQALARAGLYEQERHSRETLDRILRVGLRIAERAMPEEVAAAVCSEARAVFGADLAQILTAGEKSLQLVWMEPPAEAMPPGAALRLTELPGLTAALAETRPLFLADAPEQAVGEARGRLRALGVRSSLGIPIVIGGRAERLLALQWRRPVPEPDPTTLALARRLADQAGLALEQADRRRAELDARRRAEETRRLLDVTAALASATTVEEVADAIVGEGVRSLAASAGLVVRRREDGEELELVRERGYAPDVSERVHGMPVRSAVPLAEAVRRNELITLESSRERAARYPEASPSSAHAAWLAVPLSVGGRAVGAIGFSFAEPRRFDDADRAFLHALARQAAQAFERARLFDAEQEARSRMERFASNLAQLHALARGLAGALSAAEVAETVGAQVAGVLDASRVTIHVLEEETGGFVLAGAVGEGSAHGSGAIPPDSPDPVAAAIREGSPLWLEVGQPRGAASRPSRAGVLGIVPMVVHEQRVGALCVEFPPGRPVDAEQRRFVETVGRQAAQPLERVRLLERERKARLEAERATERTRGLQSVAQALARASTPAEVGEVLVREGLTTLAGAAAAVYARAARSDGLELLAHAGHKESELEPWRRLGLDDGGPVAEALAADEPLVVGPHAALEERYPALAGSYETIVFVPLALGSRSLGTFAVAFREPRSLDADDFGLVLTLARQSAQALERARLFELERAAADRVRRLQAITAALAGTLTVDEVARVIVSEGTAAVGAQAGFLSLASPDGDRLELKEAVGYPAELVRRYRRLPSSAPVPAALAFRSGAPVWLESAEEVQSAYPPDLEPGAAWDAEGFVPLSLPESTIGVLGVGFLRSRELTEDDKLLLLTLARQCAQALDRARRYDVERAIAETLQRSVLPERLPELEGVELAARYLPGTAGVDVGGDWFDAIPLEDGRVGLVVGDVVGKGVRAAATMGQIRNALRAFALDQLKPSSVLRRLNRLVESLVDAPFATVAYLVVDPGRGSCRYAVAGHPPPLHVSPDGRASFLEGGRSLPLGVGADVRYTHELVPLEPGATIVLYTDGLVERRGRSLEDGLERLRRSVERAPRDPERLLDHVLEHGVGARELADDVALLAARLVPARVDALRLTLDADAASLVRLRGLLTDWLAATEATADESSDIVLATWEACANAIEHPREPAEAVFSVEAERENGAIRVRVEDTGRWKEEVPGDDRGLGLRLMRSLMGSVEVTPGEGGTVITMRRELGQRVTA